MYSPLWKITHQNPSVLCTPPFEKSPIHTHRFCVLPPVKNHPSKPIGFVYSPPPLWKIPVFWWALISEWAFISANTVYAVLMRFDRFACVFLNVFLLIRSIVRAQEICTPMYCIFMQSMCANCNFMYKIFLIRIHGEDLGRTGHNRPAELQLIWFHWTKHRKKFRNTKKGEIAEKRSN